MGPLHREGESIHLAVGPEGGLLHGRGNGKTIQKTVWMRTWPEWAWLGVEGAVSQQPHGSEPGHCGAQLPLGRRLSGETGRVSRAKSLAGDAMKQDLRNVSFMEYLLSTKPRPLLRKELSILLFAEK